MVQTPSRPLKVGLHLPHWADLAALARQAEAVDFDSLWVAGETCCAASYAGG
jgi:alkanesulfonate monooxygenase SsuD/methylene tetrahydromethanopterin reductase-like flavin-dependent oxidoreductase (luciferase family)